MHKIEKELVREVETLKCLKRSPSGPGGPNNARNKPLPAKLDAHLKNLESERDFYKREVDTLQELLRTKQLQGPSHFSRRESGTSPSARSKSPTKANTNRPKSTSPGKSNPMVNRCTVCSGRSISPGQQTLAVEEIRKLKREKEELKALLEKFESYMEQVLNLLIILKKTI